MGRSFVSRAVLTLLIGYVAVAALTRIQEANGMYRCACDADCWCKRPGLSLFRWVFPRYHRNRVFADWKLLQFEG